MSAVFRKTALAAGVIMCLAGQGWARPNLVVSEFSMTPATPVQGESVHVRIGVYNTGDTAAGRYHVEWWPGENFADGAACNWTIEGTVPGGGRIIECDYSGYPSWYSSINTRVIVDALDDVSESNEADNDRRFPIEVARPSSPAGRPNLFISELSLDPATPVQGQPVNVRVGVYNNGSAPAGPSRVAWWPGENYPDPACRWNLGGLPANGGRILTCTYSGYPSWYGRINTRAAADVTGAVAESDEGDNDRRMRIEVARPSSPAGRPNLFISELSLDPATPVQGQPVRVRVGVYNNGSAPAGPSRVAWWPGENYPNPACQWNLGGLAANGGRILTCTYSGYPSWYGRINTRAAADVNGAVAESDEGDNDRRMGIRVRRP
ncbi:hypothetical protein C2I36_09035 [Rhodobacteraceae bacterium WD3A24]|nr:hypothetical protein C2I36_09035 [Rhodobacteraceae bacterium WD3A24]